MCEASGEDCSTFSNVAYLIGDKNSFIFNSLAGSTGTASSVGGLWHGELTLDTKYYSCSLILRSFPSVKKAQEWSAGKREEIGAVIYQFCEECTLPDVKKALQYWNVDTQIIVCEQLEHRATWAEEIKRFCVVQGIELIELDPVQETLDELAEYRETYGVPRILQVLETTDWVQRVLKDPRRQARNSKGAVGSSCTCEAGKESPRNLNKEQRGSEFSSIKAGLFGVLDAGLGGTSAPNEEDDFGEFQSGFGDMKHNDGGVSTCKGKTEAEEILNAEAESSTSGEPKKILSAKDVTEKLKKDIDKLVEDDSSVDDMVKKFTEVRSQLSQMSFGPDRQNFAADAMMQMIKMLGDDLLNDSSEEEA